MSEIFYSKYRLQNDMEYFLYRIMCIFICMKAFLRWPWQNARCLHTWPAK